MPDEQGKQSGPGTETPDQAYKDGRSDQVQEGSLGADTGGKGAQESRLPEGREEDGSYQSGGFAGQDADDSPDAGLAGSASGEGDAGSASYDQTKREEGGAGLDVGEGAKDPAPGSIGNVGAEEVAQRGIGQQPTEDATDPEERQTHPKTPS